MNTRLGRVQAKKTAALALAVAVATAGLWMAAPTPSAQAEAIYTYTDKPLEDKVPGDGVYLTGDHMVWYQEDGKGYQQIFYKNLKTGVGKQITDFPSIKDNPRMTVTDAGQAVVIWIDKRYVGGGSGMWDVMARFVETGEELKLSSTIAPHVHVQASGNLVTWSETGKRNMFYYDLGKRQETAIGIGKDPHAADGKIAFITGDGDVAVYSILTGETSVLVDLPYHLFPTELTYNGTYLLWKESNLDWRTKYVMLDTADPSALPVDLTPQTYKEKEYPNLYIGNQQAAWVEWKDGIQQLTGFSFAHGETHAIASGEFVIKTLDFQGDQLLMQGADGSLVYRTVVRTVEAPGQGSSGSSGASAADSNSVRGMFGPEGGTLSMKDGKASLVIPKDAFPQATEVALEDNHSVAMPKTIPHAIGEKHAASLAWQVEFDGKLSGDYPLRLVIAVEDLRFASDEKRKASIYRYSGKGNEWNRIGGSTLQANEVSADIRESGTYAVFINRVSFADVTGHWSQKAVETLAAKEIVNGMAGTRFEPDAGLTRAQFTKMLLGAMGILQTEKVSEVFHDVPASHWSSGWVEAAAELGIVQGSDGSFRPDDQLTREQMVVMLIRALGEEKAALAFDETLVFHDADAISAWAYGYAALASEMGLVQGSEGLFRPKSVSTRAQAAAVIYRLMEMTKTL
ncbi:MAG: hypothetical protein K0Q63_2288 [Paenibacillus sp.]|nr:hypothetical protein [Paenibacillus sp.]